MVIDKCSNYLLYNPSVNAKHVMDMLIWKTLRKPTWIMTSLGESWSGNTELPLSGQEGLGHVGSGPRLGKSVSRPYLSPQAGPGRCGGKGARCYRITSEGVCKMLLV